MKQEEIKEFIESEINPTQALNALMEICLENIKNGNFNKEDSIKVKKIASVFYNKVNEDKNFMIKVK